MSEFYNREQGGSRQVLVYLHGHGSAPDMVHPFFRQHHDDGWVRLCPQASLPTDGGWSWFDSGPRGVDRAALDTGVAHVRSLVEATTSELGTDWSGVVVGGFSQGAAMALALAAAVTASADDPPLGGLLVQAGFLPEVIGDEVDLGAVRCDALLVQQGDADEVVPAYMATDLAAMIGTGSGAVGSVEVDVSPGGHTLTQTMLDGARAWLTRLG